jgi:ribosomal protein L29
MKFKEIKDKSQIELKKMLSEHRENIREMRFKVANRGLKNVRDLRKAKKTVARILTSLTGK